MINNNDDNVNNVGIYSNSECKRNGFDIVMKLKVIIMEILIKYDDSLENEGNDND